MIAIIITIGLLNIIDLAATVEWITKYPDLEANPWMRALWLYSPGLFVFAKIITTAIFCFIAYRFRNVKLMRHLIWVPLFIYSITAGMHLVILLK